MKELTLFPININKSHIANRGFLMKTFDSHSPSLTHDDDEGNLDDLLREIAFARNSQEEAKAAQKNAENRLNQATDTLKALEAKMSSLKCCDTSGKYFQDVLPLTPLHPLHDNLDLILDNALTSIPPQHLWDFLAKVESYNKKPFLASGVVSSEFEFGQIIWVQRRFKGYRGKNRIDYSRDNAPKGIVMRETKDRVGFVPLNCYMKDDFSCAIQLDVQDKRGMTPLHHTCEKGSWEVMKVLCDAESNDKLVNDSGKTPYDLANTGTKVFLLIFEEEQPNSADSSSSIALRIAKDWIPYYFELDVMLDVST